MAKLETWDIFQGNSPNSQTSRKFQVLGGDSPNSHVEGIFQNLKNIPTSDSRNEFGKFPNSFSWDISQGNSPNSQISGKFPSSLEKFPKFPCRGKLSKIKKYIHLRLRFPKGIWDVPKFLFLEHFPREFP